MTLVFDRRGELGAGPGAHALLCGISEYPHLPDGSEGPTRFDFGFRQLSAPSRTARAISAWLVDHADQLAAPLATIRLLLAPNRADDGAAHDVGVERPDLDSFLRAAAAWRADASAHREGVAIFYIGGHGFILSRADQLVLLHDYGDGIGSILRNAINVGSVFQGMAPTTWTPDIARTQLYFVDSGQSFTTLPPELGSSAPTQVFDLPPDPGTDRVAITFSPAPGAVAYGRIGGLSIFGEALLECFEGLAAEQIGGGWGVTTLGLIRALPEAVRRRMAEFEDMELRQDVTAGGLIGPALVARLPGPPEADLTVAIPEEASSEAVVTVRDSTLSPVVEHGPGVEPRLHIRLPAGLYVVELTASGKEPVRETVSLLPSTTTHVALEPAA